VKRNYLKAFFVPTLLNFISLLYVTMFFVIFAVKYPDVMWKMRSKQKFNFKKPVIILTQFPGLNLY